jgi:hypothetical protein
MMDAKFNFKLLKSVLCNAQAVTQVTHALNNGRGTTIDCF